MSPIWYVLLAIVLFAIGASVVLTRRSAVLSLMGVEIMLSAANLVFIIGGRIHANANGQVLAFFVMVVAAAEVVVGLAIIVSIFRARGTTSLDELSLLKN
ncbi:NADH-quinone oxidoreductase subunit K [Boudabousia liubingyangii]|uniref:NADH-quinone oxidoreductase subunit K n=1 Tax=Boudabousia liubingyangii TaxID=1921764 RepID=A0A1Q5PQ69_9ACTO|nr:NADH-quinone oxidoreductase subunit NuoK [Boudabousia liubingyangii]OKL48291.1 NADH-quinone oxidoreductase subunit K [Boudabousia liubingyangii]OKL49673.1 NADH-quinone oxidoreductase subunit K [Boudabousia liubingyangii]